MLNLQGPWVVRGLAAIGTLLIFMGLWLAWGTLRMHTPQPEYGEAAIYMIQLAEQQVYVTRLILAAALFIAGVVSWVGACIVAAIHGKP
ncbi:hypothetical protein Saro_2735 [Novosphingobium aromaticivorans DSM 12444]|uniref:Transmembrane protein n=1 Tax=Novosphingobium aromaticivorans (strain ATCC 700278 / DSM 12444 / CCUG 56034 / CIP 105152 / NBRC 16084 / F199) TaxID=279238 RepID=Q2G4Q2_NOVAD|nr:hypothetical protein [Novosphingobium aromaticivorans]ABD27171.1 hypothetical protein Saro_2735 [Novosphingobium aromaticivorans DSM 12444]SCY89754.1 hypothetical protein SAMN05660666_03490 [Novosphingobium aromaticivorans]